MKLTKHFLLEEFTTSAGVIIIPTNEQRYCLGVLCVNILEPIRVKFKNAIKINSGLRNNESYKKMISLGYKPSITSDHFAWCKENPTGTGAADIVVENTNMKDVFDWSVKTLFSVTNQIIYYEDNGFIHISNAFSKIFMMPRDQNNHILINKGGVLYKPSEV